MNDTPHEHNEADLKKRIDELDRENAQLKRWKEEQLAVESTWDEQRVGAALCVEVGKPIRPAIYPAICAILKNRKDLLEENEKLKAQLDIIQRYCEGEYADPSLLANDYWGTGWETERGYAMSDTQKLIDCDAHKCDEEEVPRSVYERMCEHALELERELRMDKSRIDWLADPNNIIGNVELPRKCVLNNPHSLRAAIDEAMEDTQ